ncbi:MAG: hypothetical protein K0Q99_2055, partial [Clostridia bacterium]|nr:hypothetical protein [Clostridia bacterium]
YILLKTKKADTIMAQLRLEIASI